MIFLDMYSKNRTNTSFDIGTFIDLNTLDTFNFPVSASNLRNYATNIGRKNAVRIGSPWKETRKRAGGNLPSENKRKRRK